MTHRLLADFIPRSVRLSLCFGALLSAAVGSESLCVAGEPFDLGTHSKTPSGPHHHPGGLGSGVTKKAANKHDWFAGTYLDPAIQRPDFFPHTLSRSIPEYRQEYNRPRYWPGWIAYKIEPSSQEAMAWQTNYCNGNYQNRTGAFVPTYYYPKPWESLNTQSRPGEPMALRELNGESGK